MYSQVDYDNNHHINKKEIDKFVTSYGFDEECFDKTFKHEQCIKHDGDDGVLHELACSALLSSVLHCSAIVPMPVKAFSVLLPYVLHRTNTHATIHLSEASPAGKEVEIENFIQVFGQVVQEEDIRMKAEKAAAKKAAAQNSAPNEEAAAPESNNYYKEDSGTATEMKNTTRQMKYTTRQANPLAHIKDEVLITNV